MEQTDLLTTYKSSIRPTIDFAAPTYHSLITTEQANSIERLQLRAMKIAFGPTVAYNTVLESGAVEPLEERRKMLVQKMAIKASRNSLIKDEWFPENHSLDLALRHREKYKIPRVQNNRTTKSPILAMRRVMNEITKRRE